MFLNDMDFGFEERASIHDRTTYGWIGAAIAAGGALVSALAGDDEEDAPDRSVMPSTVSGNKLSNMDYLFNTESVDALSNLTTQMGEWSQADRGFFENTFRPFQEELINTNKQMLPVIAQNSTMALEQNIKDLMSSENLKSVFTNNAAKMGGQVGDIADSFAQEMGNLPTEQDRIGQAISGIEQQFGKAGEEIKRQLASQGTSMTQTTIRDLAMQKAQAKAGATMTAAERARAERRTALAEGVGVLGAAQSNQSNQFAQQQGITQAGANLVPQVGGVQATEGVGAAGTVGADLLKSSASQVVGTREASKTAQFTQTGIANPIYDEKGVATQNGVDVGTPRVPVAPVGPFSSNNPTVMQKFGGGPGVDYGGQGVYGGQDFGGVSIGGNNAGMSGFGGFGDLGIGNPGSYGGDGPGTPGGGSDGGPDAGVGPGV